MKQDALIERALFDVFGLQSPETELLETIRAELTVHELVAGDVLMREGDPSDALFILLRGRLVVSLGADEDESFIGEIRRGETIGETGLVMNTPRNATVRASRASTVARIGAESFYRLLGQYPQLSLAIARTLITRETRNSGPRHPGYVPETLCLVAVTGGVDLRMLASGLATRHGAPVTIVEEGGDIDAGRHAIHKGERETGLVIVLASRIDSAWARMAVAEADEVVRVADARAEAAPCAQEAELDRVGGMLPRQTLLLIHPDDTRSPRGTDRWLAGRRLDRHLHMRPGHAEDQGRVARILTGRAVGLVLAGGGARGAAHMGAIRALAEAGIVPDMVGGTSIGAAMAAWYAMGLRGADLERAARKVFVESGGPTNDWNLLPLISLVKGRKTRDLGQQAIREATGADIGIEDTWTPFFCVSANYTTQMQTVLRKGPLWRALTATYAIPGVLPPVPMDGGLHVDGGVVNNLPVDVMEQSGAARTVAVDLLGPPSRALELEELPSTLALLIDRLRGRRKRRYRIPGLVSILLNSTVLSSLERQREMRNRADLCLRPELMRIGLLDWGKFDAAIEQGYGSVAGQLAALGEPGLEDFRTAPRRS